MGLLETNVMSCLVVYLKVFKIGQCGPALS